METQTYTVWHVPDCRCGTQMVLTNDWEPLNGSYRRVCRCPRHRWWNAWLHPDSYTLESR